MKERRKIKKRGKNTIIKTIRNYLNLVEGWRRNKRKKKNRITTQRRIKVNRTIKVIEKYKIRKNIRK